MGNPQIWIGRVTGVLSILGSLSIIYMILSDRRKKLVRPYHRLMLMMSLFHVIQTLAVVINVAAVPIESNIDGAKGNKQTCMAQGFFVILGLATPLYNSSLNIYYSLTIRYNISSEQFTRFEPVLHTVSILVPFSAAIIFTACDFMAPIMEGACSARGKIPLYTYQSIFGLSFLICIVSMACICWTVIPQAKRMEKYTHFGRGAKARTGKRGNSSSMASGFNRNKKETAKQALLYISAFILTYLFPFVGAIQTRGEAGKVPPHAIIILTSMFYPLQGFWNFWFYIRPGVRLVMLSNPEMSCFQAITVVVFRPDSTVVNRKRSKMSNVPESTNSSMIVEDDPHPNKSRFCVRNTEDESYIESQLSHGVAASSTRYPRLKQKIETVHDSQKLDSESLKDATSQILTEQKELHDSSIPLSNSSNHGSIKVKLNEGGNVATVIPAIPMKLEEANIEATSIVSNNSEIEDDPEKQSITQGELMIPLRRLSLIDIGSILNLDDCADIDDY